VTPKKFVVALGDFAVSTLSGLRALAVSVSTSPLSLAAWLITWFSYRRVSPYFG